MSTTTAAGLDLDRVPSTDRQQPWLTVNVRPAGSFGREDMVRLASLLDVLSATASMVVLDLAAVSLRSHHAAVVIDGAAVELERRGGCLLCINADDEVRAQLDGCTHAMVVAPGERAPVGAPR